MAIAAYDEIADWYAEWVDGSQNEFSDRVRQQLEQLLGEPVGGDVCIDVACGTGARAKVLREMGWRPVGVDLSKGQLRHAAQVMPVAAADATALPIRTGAADSVVCVLCHTDLPDYAAVVREAARVLKPGGRFVHIGVHPAFIGAFADRSDTAKVIVDSGYHRRERRFESWTEHGVRTRVGAWHTPMAELIQMIVDAGLTLHEVRESSPEGGVPDMFSLAARR